MPTQSLAHLIKCLESLLIVGAWAVLQLKTTSSSKAKHPYNAQAVCHRSVKLCSKVACTANDTRGILQQLCKAQKALVKNNRNTVRVAVLNCHQKFLLDVRKCLARELEYWKSLSALYYEVILPARCYIR